MVAAVKVIAVDWSGRATGEAEYIWAATVRDGLLVDLWNGRSRDEVTQWLLGLVDDGPLVVGLDFAFSFPRWWCEQSGWASAEDAWKATAASGEAWLAAATWPFWGRPGAARDLPSEERLRRTEAEVRGSAKSVFQIGGAGAVGTGSIRGMPELLQLAGAGFAIWPFHASGEATVVEIYPRALTLDGSVRKSRWSDRHAYLTGAAFRGQPDGLLERAAGSEDAFDAAISALTMSAHSGALANLRASQDPDYAIEGRIWTPAGGGSKRAATAPLSPRRT